MTHRDSIPTAVAYGVQKDTLVHADDHPADQDGFYWDRFIPGDLVADPDRDIAAAHAAGFHETGVEEDDRGARERVCYECGTRDW